MIECDFSEVASAVNAVESLKRASGRIGFGGALLQPVHKSGRLIGVTETEKCVDRESRIAYPRVAIVPVANSANLFGKAARGSRYDGSGGGVREQLQGKRGPHHHFAPSSRVAT